MPDRKKFFYLTVVALLLVAGSACWPSIPQQRGRVINPYLVDDIKLGVTTKDWIMSRFGPPRAVAVKGELLLVKNGPDWVGEELWTPGLVKIQQDKFFEFFKDSKKVGPEYRVYYYFYSVQHRVCYGLPDPNGQCPGLLSHEEYWAEMDRLWILVNEKTGFVEDYVFLPREE